MTEQSEAFAPQASSQHVLAQYKNPFGFSLQVVKSAQDITLSEQGVSVAQVRRRVLQGPNVKTNWNRASSTCRSRMRSAEYRLATSHLSSCRSRTRRSRL